MSQFLESCSGLDEAAHYFLHQSYKELYSALADERAGLLFNELADAVDVPDDWKLPELPRSNLELLAFDGDVIPPETTRALVDAWNEAQREAETSGPKLTREHTVVSVAIAGHVVNLFLCVEAITNKHLLYLREAGEISGDTYKALDSAGVIPRLMFLYRDQVQQGTLHLGHLRTLARMRNDAVHYRGRSRSKLAVKLKTLIDVSTAVGSLLGIVDDTPSEETLKGYLLAATEPHLQ